VKPAEARRSTPTGRSPFRASIRAALLIAFLAHGHPAFAQTTGMSPYDTARARLREDRQAEAIPLLQSELRMRPNNDDARLLLARVLSWQRRYDESLAEYRELLAKKPNDATLRAGYARVLAWSGRHQEAAREFKTAIQADSTNLETRVGYARVLSWSGDLAEASTEYQRILAADPRTGDAWLGLASVARWRGAATASDRYVARAESLHADPEATAEEKGAVATALRPSLGTGWSASHEREYVDLAPDFTLETDGPYIQGRGTLARRATLTGRVSWLDLVETPGSGPAKNYDLSSVVTRVDGSFLRGYPWQAAASVEHRSFDQNPGTMLFPLGEDDTFFGWGARVWRFSGRFTPRGAIHRDYVALKETAPDTAFVPGHVDEYEGGLGWQWNARGAADAVVSRGVYSDDNRRWTAGGGASYKVKTATPSVTVDSRLTYRDWDFTSRSYFTPLGSVRGSAGVSIAGYVERSAVDYGFRYEFAGINSTNFADIWTHAWSGYLNLTAFGTLPLGLEASYSVDNNSYETWYLGVSGSARW